MESSFKAKNTGNTEAEKPIVTPLLFDPSGTGMDLQVVADQISGLKTYIDKVLIPATRQKIDDVRNDQSMKAEERERIASQYEAGLLAVSGTNSESK